MNKVEKMVKFVEEELNDNNKWHNAHITAHGDYNEKYEEITISFETKHKELYAKTIIKVAEMGGIVRFTDVFTLATVIRFYA